MKLSELKPCAACGGKLTPIWHVIREGPALLKLDATRQVLGLTDYFGGLGAPGALALAEAMGPEVDVVVIGMDENPPVISEAHICNNCYCQSGMGVGEIMERANRQRDND